MNFATRRRLWILIVLTACAGFIGGFVALGQTNRPTVYVYLHGMVDGLLIGSALGIYQLFVYNSGRGRFFWRLSFLLTLLVNSLAYAAIIVVQRSVGRILMGQYSGLADVWADAMFVPSVSVALVFSVVFNLALQISDLIGAAEFRRFIAGRYHRPRTEERVFLFVDLVSSTAIAEQIGPQAFLSLLDSIYRDMTEAILRTRAEVYKYVGDEIILTWSRAQASADCFRLLGFFLEDLERRRTFYEEEFGLFPEFRAALHGGQVVTGELGLLKKEIAYLGDVLNTSARVLEACAKLGKRFLCTASVQKLLTAREDGVVQSMPKDIGLTKMGRARLRGRQEPVELWAVHVP